MYLFNLLANVTLATLQRDMFIRTYVRADTRTYVRKCMYLCMYLCMYACMYIRMHVCTACCIRGVIQSQSPISILLVSLERNVAKET